MLLLLSFRNLLYYLLLSHQYLIILEVMLKDATQQPYDSFLLILDRLFLKHLLKIFNIVYFLTLHLRKLDLPQWILDNLLSHIPSYRGLTKEINQWILLKKFLQNIFLKSSNTRFDLFNISDQIYILEIDLEHLIPLSYRPNYRIELFSIDELVPVYLLLMVVVCTPSQAYSCLFGAGGLTTKLMYDTVVWVAKREESISIHPIYVLLFENWDII